MNKKRTIKRNETIRLSILLAVCLLLLVATIVVACKAFSKGKTTTADTSSPQYIELSIVEGANLADTKVKLDSADISYEIVPTSSKTPNKVEKIEYIGKEENGKIFVEVGTSVKLHANEVGMDKIIYLTFDDGPTRDNTLNILDTLDSYGIKATFFVQGKNVKNYPDRIVATVQRGHLVGCHSYSHEIGEIYQDVSSFLDEIEEYEKVVKEALGESVFASMNKVIRFPGGTTTNSMLSRDEAKQFIASVRASGYAVYDWIILTGDAQGNSTAQEFIDSLKEGLEENNEANKPLIALLHDKWSTNESLSEILDYLVNEGYYFDTIDNCPEYTFAEN